MKKQPLISILMPVYNAGFFVSEAIESIISQTYSNWELICVDDGSKDNSLRICKEFLTKDKRIKILRNQKNRGISFSLNKTIVVAKGEYIARMDADDLSMPDRLEKQLVYLQKNPKIIACGGQVEIINREGEFLAQKNFPLNPKDCYRQIFKSLPLQHAALMVKAEVIKKYQYLENLPTAEDVDMLFYLLSCGEVGNIKETIYQYRKTDSSNGYHSVKKTFYLTLITRLKAIKKYNYQPSIEGILFSLAQLIVVTILPPKWVVILFETLRFRKYFSLTVPSGATKLIPNWS